MSGVSLEMRGTSFYSLEEIAEAMKSSLKAELIHEYMRQVGEVKICILSFEKYFFRNGSYASLTVVLTEEREEKTADIIGSGGGEGLFNISWGANKELVLDAEGLLKKFGLS